MPMRRLRGITGFPATAWGKAEGPPVRAAGTLWGLGWPQGTEQKKHWERAPPMTVPTVAAPCTTRRRAGDSAQKSLSPEPADQSQLPTRKI
eukprot:9495630-Pyramimonas_sp.AAC.1